MRRPCSNPWCRDGLVTTWVAPPHRKRSELRPRTCPVCLGAGIEDEDTGDLLAAGIVVWDASDEDFRSDPFHWEPGLELQ